MVKGIREIRNQRNAKKIKFYFASVNIRNYLRIFKKNLEVIIITLQLDNKFRIYYILKLNLLELIQ